MDLGCLTREKREKKKKKSQTHSHSNPWYAHVALSGATFSHCKEGGVGAGRI